VKICNRLEAYGAWLQKLATQPTAFGLSEAVLSGFVRVVTNPKIFRQPTPLDRALLFCENLSRRPHARILRPGEHNWEIFESLCREGPARCAHG